MNGERSQLAGTHSVLFYRSLRQLQFIYGCRVAPALIFKPNLAGIFLAGSVPECVCTRIRSAEDTSAGRELRQPSAALPQLGHSSAQPRHHLSLRRRAPRKASNRQGAPTPRPMGGAPARPRHAPGARRQVARRRRQLPMDGWLAHFYVTSLATRYRASARGSSQGKSV